MRIDKNSFMAALAAAGLMGSAFTGCGGDAEATETEAAPEDTSGSEAVSEDTTAYGDEDMGGGDMGDMGDTGDTGDMGGEEDLGPTPE
jgi:hypothetical protein